MVSQPLSMMKIVVHRELDHTTGAGSTAFAKSLANGRWLACGSVANTVHGLLVGPSDPYPMECIGFLSTPGPFEFR